MLVEGGEIQKIRFSFITDFYGSMLKLKREIRYVIRRFLSKVLGVRCWGWVVGGGKMHLMRFGIVTDFLWVKIEDKK